MILQKNGNKNAHKYFEACKSLPSANIFILEAHIASYADPPAPWGACVPLYRPPLNIRK